MKATFHKIHCCFEVAFATLLNATRFLAIQDNIGEAFYDRLFQ